MREIHFGLKLAQINSDLVTKFITWFDIPNHRNIDNNR